MKRDQIVHCMRDVTMAAQRHVHREQGLLGLLEHVKMGANAQQAEAVALLMGNCMVFDMGRIVE